MYAHSATPIQGLSSLPSKESVLSALDKSFMVLANFSLGCAVALSAFFLLAAPGQPLDFLMQGNCIAG